MNYNKKSQSGMPSWVVVVIILVLGAGIIFVFYSSINWTGTVDKEACHSSAVLRASSPEILKMDLIKFPLNCQTEKICISKSFLAKTPVRKFFGNCEKFVGEKNIRKETVSSMEDVNKIIADAMYDCWWQLYLEENPIFDPSITEKKVYCGICARIAFDSVAIGDWGVEKNPDKTYLSGGIIGLKDYFKTKIPNSDKSYYDYFFRGVNPTLVESKEIPIDPSQEYAIVFTEIQKSSAGAFFSTVAGCGTGLITAGVLSSVPVVGWIVGPAATIGLVAGGCFIGNDAGNMISKFFTDNKKGFTVEMNLRPYSVEDLKKCDSIFTMP